MRWIVGAGLLGIALSTLAPWELVAAVGRLALFPALLIALGVAWSVRQSRPGLAAFGGLAAGLALTMTAERVQRARAASDASGAEFTVVSHNVLFRGGDRTRTLRLLAEQQADVLLLQEVTSGWTKRLASLAPHRVVAPHNGTHGLAILSRYPLSRERRFVNDQGRLIGQCVEVGIGKGVDVCHVHLASPSGAITQTPRTWGVPAALEDNAQLRRRQWTRLEQQIRERHDPIVIAGDFNSLPSEGLLVDARRRWVDAARHHAWLSAAPTWPRLAASAHQLPWPLDHLADLPWPLHELAPTGPWFRIDYVLCAPRVAILEASRLRGGGSDHLAVRAALRLP